MVNFLELLSYVAFPLKHQKPPESSPSFSEQLSDHLITIVAQLINNVLS